MIGDRWGVSDAEMARHYGCDDLVPEPVLGDPFTHAFGRPQGRVVAWIRAP